MGAVRHASSKQNNKKGLFDNAQAGQGDCCDPFGTRVGEKALP
jgi:hypothetical protein